MENRTRRVGEFTNLEPGDGVQYLMQEGAEVRIIIQDAKDGIRDDSYLSNSKRERTMCLKWA